MNEQKSSVIPKELVDDIKLAKIAQERRREAPPVTMTSVERNPRKVMIETFAPECVGPDATHHAMFGDIEKYKENIQADGYEPVLNRGERVMGGKDPLLKIPLDIHEENKRLAPMLSEHRLGEKSEEVADNSGALSEKSEVIKSGTARFDEVKSGGLKEYD